ncbi:MAG: lamin tail domain-containing protein [Bacteroidales bacterium]|nr:lamin tail domain-containing protein [Bacteroidales bacterium]
MAIVCRVCGQSGLLISELLYEPRSGEAEWVELYNSGASPVELSRYSIVRWTGSEMGASYALPPHTVAPYGYVVLTRDAASVVNSYAVADAGAIVECNLPPYPNTGGSVILCNASGAVVDRLDYLPSMHSQLLHDKTGVSLERRWYDHPTNEVGNWFSASSTHGYATPGSRNSQSMELLAEERSFDFSTAVLSPDGDGVDDELAISYELAADRPLSGRAEVYDLRGRMVRRLLGGDVLGSHGAVVWNGRDEQGRLLPPGQYVVVIMLYNEAGQQQIIKRSVGYLLP